MGPEIEKGEVPENPQKVSGSRQERLVMPAGPDGTRKLCVALYGRKETARDYIGGYEAGMLHDAAKKITQMQVTMIAVAAWLARERLDDRIPDEIAERIVTQAIIPLADTAKTLKA